MPALPYQERWAALSVNIGSSSLKYALYAIAAGRLDPIARLRGSYERLDAAGQAAALRDLTDRLAAQSVRPDNLAFVAHRIVHGGRLYRRATELTDSVLSVLAEFDSLAPLHQPFNLQGVVACQTAFPGVPQIGCFDTAFHADLPETETRFALPGRFYDQGIQRYGFHGLSYQYLVRRLAESTPRAAQRMLMAHLGSGASLCAAVAGRSRATTMGFSALDGLMMGTRSGAVDPGVLLYWMAEGRTVQEITQILYKESGLLGVSAISSDIRILRASADPAAQRAIDLFTHRVVREAGGLVALLGGLDVLAFTGGIGEHDALLRAEVCSRLGFLGITLDTAANASVAQEIKGGGPVAIHASGSPVEVWVVATDEGRVAAEEALGLYSQSLGV
ncbi:MAG: acetate/propionate family kinase [Burkholderiaceae bacterium]